MSTYRKPEDLRCCGILLFGVMSVREKVIANGMDMC